MHSAFRTGRARGPRRRARRTGRSVRRAPERLALGGGPLILERRERELDLLGRGALGGEPIRARMLRVVWSRMPSMAHSLSPHGARHHRAGDGNCGGRPRPFATRGVGSGRRGLEPAERHGVGREQHVTEVPSGSRTPQVSPASIHSVHRGGELLRVGRAVPLGRQHDRGVSAVGPRAIDPAVPAGGRLPPRIRRAAGRAPAREPRLPIVITSRSSHPRRASRQVGTSTGVGASFGYRSGWMICSVDTGGPRTPVHRVDAAARLERADEPHPLVVRPRLQLDDERRDALGRRVLLAASIPTWTCSSGVRKVSAHGA